jgi:uncharacterized protein YndB with AHSA1/START domain
MSKPSFVYVTYIATTAEKVWQALTDGNVTRRYWGPLNPDPNHVAPFENVSDWQRGSSWTHRQLDEAKTVGIVGKVLESTPHRRLVLTWARPKDADNAEKTSRVTFDIEPQGKGVVKLTVLHEDLDAEMHQGVSGGWPQILSNLKTLLETGHALRNPETRPSP